jgi:hypothetical protein
VFPRSFMLGIKVITRSGPSRCRRAYQSRGPQDDAGPGVNFFGPLRSIVSAPVWTVGRLDFWRPCLSVDNYTWSASTKNEPFLCSCRTEKTDFPAEISPWRSRTAHWDSRDIRVPGAAVVTIDQYDTQRHWLRHLEQQTCRRYSGFIVVENPRKLPTSARCPSDWAFRAACRFNSRDSTTTGLWLRQSGVIETTCSN